MSDHHESRRGVDPYILEMHGWVKEMSQMLKNHIERDEEIQGRHTMLLEKQHELISPVVEFHKSAQTVGEWVKWMVKYMSIPVLSGVGIGIWAWIKVILSHPTVAR